LLLSLCFVLTSFVQSEARQAPPFNPKVEGMKLMKLVSGMEALKAINQLHGMAIPMKAGFIAHYLGNQGKATVWVSEAPSTEAGGEQIEVMIEKMKANQRSPFSDYGHSTVNDVEVIRFQGMGQVHGVFQIGPWVYWISANGNDLETLLGHLCKPGATKSS
jgi:hypothetical protein